MKVWKLFDFSIVNYKHNEAFCKAFGAYIRKFRKDRGYTLRGLADLCDIEHSQIRRIEKGEINTSISTTYTLAKGLGISHKELFNFPFTNREKK